MTRLWKWAQVFGMGALITFAVIWGWARANSPLGLQYFFVSEFSDLECKNNAAKNYKSDQQLGILYWACEGLYPPPFRCADGTGLCIKNPYGQIIDLQTNSKKEAWQFYYQSGGHLLLGPYDDILNERKN